MTNIQAPILSMPVVERFGQHLLSRGRSEETVRAYVSDLKMFFLDVDGDVRVEDFEDVALVWLNKDRRAHSPKTTNRRLTSLRCFARYVGIANPLEDYSRPHSGPSVPHPIPEGIAGVMAMIGHAKNDEQRALVALCGLVGCRISEALSVRPADFNVDEMLLTIRGKGDKTRVVPVSSLAWGILCGPVSQAYIKSADYVVGYRDRFARRCITNTASRAGLSRGVASHDLRATFATATYNKTLNLRLVQELLGHSSSQTTEVYTMVEMGKMREAVELDA